VTPDYLYPARPPGPLELSIWRAAPFLPLVPAEVLTAGGEAEARAMQFRVEAEVHACLFCGERAAAALVARPKATGMVDGAGPVSVRPRFVDLCMPHFSALNAEVQAWPGLGLRA
jgi:hypothetical protein